MWCAFIFPPDLSGDGDVGLPFWTRSPQPGGTGWHSSQRSRRARWARTCPDTVAASFQWNRHGRRAPNSTILEAQQCRLSFHRLFTGLQFHRTFDLNDVSLDIEEAETRGRGLEDEFVVAHLAMAGQGDGRRGILARNEGAWPQRLLSFAAIFNVREIFQVTVQSFNYSQYSLTQLTSHQEMPSSESWMRWRTRPLSGRRGSPPGDSAATRVQWCRLQCHLCCLRRSAERGSTWTPSTARPRRRGSCCWTTLYQQIRLDKYSVEIYSVKTFFT